jgi:hypothetical protein
LKSVGLEFSAAESVLVDPSFHFSVTGPLTLNNGKQPEADNPVALTAAHLRKRAVLFGEMQPVRFPVPLASVGEPLSGGENLSCAVPAHDRSTVSALAVTAVPASAAGAIVKCCG